MIAAFGRVVGTLKYTTFCIIGLSVFLVTSAVAIKTSKLMGVIDFISSDRMWMAASKLDLFARGNIKLLGSICLGRFYD